MSYLTLANGIPDFSKAVISFWFRVPMESAIARSQASGGADPLSFTLPLLVFGKREQTQPWQYLFGNVSNDPDKPLQAFYGWEIVGAPLDSGPSYIGVLPNRDGTGTFDLEFRFQLDTFGSYSALGWVVDPPAIWNPGSTTVNPYFEVTPKDTSPTILYGPPEYFYVLTGRPTGNRSLNLQPDAWHHLLLSFDLSGALSVGQPFANSNCKMWYAIDDNDYRGPENLQPYRDSDDTLESNNILTSNIHTNSGDFSNTFFGTTVPAPSGNYAPTPIVASGQKLGIPATADYVQDILRVEMAELQMWTGVTLDTGITSNRRVFVDKDGKPVSPTEGATEEDPRGLAEKLLGKKPDVLLHGSSNWKSGKNTGTLGIEISSDGEETIIPSGQFTPVAGIEAYKPDPSLEETTA